ncbi:hypothetical protein SLUN_24695 [Streptomyces lunaelactis]|uniref:Uncharacterized protein n=1 Tax=Streptomyces lunaelactis TaxID=1535768 RepID=A0A2R4T700_9ACTN|nr:hypothetical protein [Streptomyces lunaelactis]AVZ74898.1 hypothetical protein SLUN_24695 [Streptomyces lunaelactis]NUK03373.1 hypothetical protein [Streptomyces lunaelactis]NUK08000.1 hypothetical protein [Streptomyces lunaelactis]NUK17695.1 hypothetical protein [Streptomyces lunaelactis]NUK25403.1 hypothetical protein [Streptomyces lunaelactis]
MASKSLRELIAQADERGLAASGLACLDRCLPLLASEADALRPLWAGLVEGEDDWSVRLGEARETMEGAAVEDEAAALVRQMLGAAPSEWEADPLREWADDCSVAALELHYRLDSGHGDGEPAAADVVEVLKSCREGEPGGTGPLVAGELRRQVQILEILADAQGGVGLRQVLELSTEGQRVLRAVVSRRARVKR